MYDDVGPAEGVAVSPVGLAPVVDAPIGVGVLARPRGAAAHLVVRVAVHAVGRGQQVTRGDDRGGAAPGDGIII